MYMCVCVCVCVCVYVRAWCVCARACVCAILCMYTNSAENNYLAMLGHMSKQAPLWSDVQTICSDAIYVRIFQ